MTFFLQIVQGASVIFPQKHLQDVHDVISQARPSIVNALISKKYSSFSKIFRDLFVNDEEIHPAAVETFQGNNNITHMAIKQCLYIF